MSAIIFNAIDKYHQMYVILTSNRVPPYSIDVALILSK